MQPDHTSQAAKFFFFFSFSLSPALLPLCRDTCLTETNCFLLLSSQLTHVFTDTRRLLPQVVKDMVNIQIGDVNDNPPTFHGQPYSVQIPEVRTVKTDHYSVLSGEHNQHLLQETFKQNYSNSGLSGYS